MVSIFASSGAALCCRSADPSPGVSTASSAPCPMASNARREFAPTLAVTIRIAHGVLAMIRRVASTPSISGMMRSISTRCGVVFAHSSTASPPCLGHPDDLMLGFERDHAPERFHRQRPIVDDADLHDWASPIRSTTACSRVSSWKLLLVR